MTFCSLVTLADMAVIGPVMSKILFMMTTTTTPVTPGRMVAS